MITAPIYKDTFYTSTSNSLHYRLYDGNIMIYEGRAVKMPGNDTLQLNINKICKDYLSSDIDLIVTGGTAETHIDALKTFTLQSDLGATLETYKFLFCWDYDFSWNGSNTTLSLPITGEYAAGMKKLKTTVYGSTVSTNSNGDYDKEVCGNYALYYLNARGGWDSFIYTGFCKKTDAITQYTFDHSYNNNTPEFEKGRYATEIKEEYELNTGLLNDEQSLLYAKHLASSNRCYLHIIDEGKIFPVVISDNSISYKQAESENNNIITYTTKVAASQIKLKQ